MAATTGLCLDAEVVEEDGLAVYKFLSHHTSNGKHGEAPVL
eukprot:CAMPEP_0171622852 /NCGR_PEP_ID=MMETSP0990-20121206/17535_1 /TAXON_ID=483369 /ORGANISM="non described non described, Strain CCMP2098" /LENGTH=40 /DNA_ID= /DNA_START= /DNA_END= /DNA_ORIENTATION=